jgi:hypothetical protein
LSDKVRVFLKPPGWKPDELGGFEGPTQKDRATYRKFDTEASSAVTGYVVSQFVMLLATTSFFLFRQGDLGTTRMWATAVLIVLWVMDLGLLLEGGRRWVLGMEVFRAVVLGTLLVLSTDLLSTLWAPIIAAVVTLATLLGLLWLARMPVAQASTSLSKHGE